MIRHSVDIYIAGALHERSATLARQGSEIRISGVKPPLRFIEVTVRREDAGTVVYQAVDSTGRRVDVVGLASTDCGCGRKG